MNKYFYKFLLLQSTLLLLCLAIFLFSNYKSLSFGAIVSIFSFFVLSFSAWFLLIKKIIALPIIAVVTKYAALFLVLFEVSKKDWFNVKLFFIGYAVSFIFLVIVFIYLNSKTKDKSVSI